MHREDFSILTTIYTQFVHTTVRNTGVFCDRYLRQSSKLLADIIAIRSECLTHNSPQYLERNLA